MFIGPRGWGYERSRVLALKAAFAPIQFRSFSFMYGEFIESMKRIIPYIVLVSAAVLIVLSLQTNPGVPGTEERGTQKAEAPRTIAVTLVVEGASHDLQAPLSSSVYDVMSRAQAAGIMEFSGKEFSGIGYFVEEINGKREDLKGRHFWILYMNGQKAKAGVSSLVVNNQDIIEWKYEDEI